MLASLIIELYTYILAISMQEWGGNGTIGLGGIWWYMVVMEMNKNILVFSLAIGSCDCGPSGSISAREENEDVSAHTYDANNRRHPGNSW